MGLGTEPPPSPMLSKCSSTELHPQPSLHSLFSHGSCYLRLMSSWDYRPVPLVPALEIILDSNGFEPILPNRLLNKSSHRLKSEHLIVFHNGKKSKLLKISAQFCLNLGCTNTEPRYKEEGLVQELSELLKHVQK